MSERSNFTKLKVTVEKSIPIRIEDGVGFQEQIKNFKGAENFIEFLEKYYRPQPETIRVEVIKEDGSVHSSSVYTREVATALPNKEEEKSQPQKEVSKDAPEIPPAEDDHFWDALFEDSTKEPPDLPKEQETKPPIREQTKEELLEQLKKMNI